ncbi:MAG TPA: hypothetical protein VK154_04290 [Chitinophagales bacterium]|nr:hypothetical protein [Chitinophagales bacterium]
MILEKRCDSYSYFREKSSTLISKLIAGEGNAKQRLGECEGQIFVWTLAPVPANQKQFKEDIVARLNKLPHKEFRGETIQSSFRASLSKMRNSTAAKIIADIYQLHEDVRFAEEQC